MDATPYPKQKSIILLKLKRQNLNKQYRQDMGWFVYIQVTIYYYIARYVSIYLKYLYVLSPEAQQKALNE